MDFDHRTEVELKFGKRLPLFSEFAYGQESALLDVYEVVPDWRNNEEAAREYGRSVMDIIFDGMPEFVDRMNRYLDRHA